MIAIGCTSIVCTVIVLNLFYHDNRHPVPRWLRAVVLKLAVVFFYQIRGHPQSEVTATCNPAFRLDGEAANKQFTESDSGVLTASCSFTDSSRSVSSDGAFSTVSRKTDNMGSNGQNRCQSRCRAYSMHIMQEVYSNGSDPAVEKKKNEKRLTAHSEHLEWKDAAMVIDRATMVLSVLITAVAMMVTHDFFLPCKCSVFSSGQKGFPFLVTDWLQHRCDNVIMLFCQPVKYVTCIRCYWKLTKFTIHKVYGG